MARSQIEAYSPSSSLILYTDGVIDARSPTGQRFDDTGIIESAKDSTHSAQAMIV